MIKILMRHKNIVLFGPIQIIPIYTYDDIPLWPIFRLKFTCAAQAASLANCIRNFNKNGFMEDE